MPARSKKNVLDDAAAMRKLDPSDMAGLLARFPSQLAHASGVDAPVAVPRGGFDGVVVCGMGGSAITGDVLSCWLGSRLSVPMMTHRSYGLPRWAGPRTLVLAVSYSGTTEETLSAVKEAAFRGCPVAGLSCGGSLPGLVREAGGPFVSVPGGQPPRASTGYLLVASVRILAGSGLIGKTELSEVEEARSVLSAMSREFSLDSPAEDSEAKRAALALHGRIAAVYASGPLEVAARRWQTQLNENAKVLAWWGAFPEMNHNELVGWVGGAPDGCSAVFLHDASYHPQVKRRMDFTRRAIEKAGGAVLDVSTRGDGQLARILSAMYVGDWTSHYMAMLRGMDPTPVDVIGELKAFLVR